MRRRFLLLVASLLTFFQQGRTQVDPSDPLGSAFRIALQSKVRQQLPPKSCLVLFSGGFLAHDPAQRYPQAFSCDPDFYFLSGFAYPDAALVIFSEPQSLSEGAVGSLLFLPDKNDRGLVSMGYAYRGKLGMQDGGWAIRPTGQWRKFCNEVLAAETLSKVYSKPVAFSSFDKPGGEGHWDLAYKLYEALAPGYPFEPQAQRFYRDILVADSAAIAPLASRIAASMEYSPQLRRDPLLERYSKVTRTDQVASIQAEIRRIKLDLVQYDCCMRSFMRLHTPEEIALVQKAVATIKDAFEVAASRTASGRREAGLAAAAAYAISLRGAIEAMPIVVASGKHVAEPNYVANMGNLPASGMLVLDLGISQKGYTARVTRTVPIGTPSADYKAIFDGVLAIHQKNIRNCVIGGSPGKIQEAAAPAFDALDKQQIFSTNALGARKVLRVNNVTSMGLSLDDGHALVAFKQGDLLSVQTALYLPDEEGVTAKWRGMAVVFRDMVWLAEDGPRVLTQSIPSTLTQLQALAAAPIPLPEE